MDDGQAEFLAREIIEGNVEGQTWQSLPIEYQTKELTSTTQIGAQTIVTIDENGQEIEKTTYTIDGVDAATVMGREPVDQADVEAFVADLNKKKVEQEIAALGGDWQMVEISEQAPVVA